MKSRADHSFAQIFGIAYVHSGSPHNESRSDVYPF